MLVWYFMYYKQLKEAKEQIKVLRALLDTDVEDTASPVNINKNDDSVESMEKNSHEKIVKALKEKNRR